MNDIDIEEENKGSLLDQLRSVDKRRLAGKMGEIELKLWHPVLLEMLE